MDLTPGPKFGDRVRVQCSATGRYVTDGWALVVSAQDNDLFMDRAVDGEPHPTLPVPTDEALACVCADERGHFRPDARCSIHGNQPRTLQGDVTEDSSSGTEEGSG